MREYKCPMCVKFTIVADMLGTDDPIKVILPCSNYCQKLLYQKIKELRGY